MHLPSIRTATYISIFIRFIRMISRRLTGNTDKATTFASSIYFPFWKDGALRAVRIDSSYMENTPEFNELERHLNTIRPDLSTVVTWKYDFDFVAFLKEQDRNHPGVINKVFLSPEVAGRLSDADYIPSVKKLLQEKFPDDDFRVSYVILFEKA